jgi:hypothetical protein
MLFDRKIVMYAQNLFIIAAAALTSASALAQMPASLHDNDAVASPAQWAAAAPILQAGLECRKAIDPAVPALRALLPKNDSHQWELVPPKGFAVFGLPVQSITLYIDSSGDYSYTASVVASMAAANKAVRQSVKQIDNSSLRIEPGDRASLIRFICTADNYDESDYQEP